MTHGRRVHLFFAVVFYGFLAATAWVWIRYGLPRPVGELFTVENRWLTYGLGIGCGLAVAGFSWLAVKLHKPTHSLEREFGWLLGNQNVPEIFLLAAMSGFAEELFFRGAVQQAIGPYFGTIVFAAAHPPFNSRLKLWPVFALFVGAIFALQFEITGNVVAPMLSHAVINLVNLLRISAKYRLLEK